MIIHCLNNQQDYSKYYSYEPEELGEYEIKNIPKEIEELWYFYGTGSYEGDGYALARIGNKYDIQNIGHCSCYGPESGLEDLHCVDSLDGIKMSQDLMNATKILFDAARKAYYGESL